MSKQIEQELQAIERFTVASNRWYSARAVARPEQQQPEADPWAAVRSVGERCAQELGRCWRLIADIKGTAPAADAVNITKLVNIQNSPSEVQAGIVGLFAGGFKQGLPLVGEQEKVEGIALSPSPLRVADLPQTPELERLRLDIASMFGTEARR